MRTLAGGSSAPFSNPSSLCKLDYIKSTSLWQALEVFVFVILFVKEVFQ